MALGIQLGLTEDLIRQDSERGLERLHELGGEVGRTLKRSRRSGGGCTRRCLPTGDSLKRFGRPR